MTVPAFAAAPPIPPGPSINLQNIVPEQSFSLSGNGAGTNTESFTLSNQATISTSLNNPSLTAQERQALEAIPTQIEYTQVVSEPSVGDPIATGEYEAYEALTHFLWLIIYTAPDKVIIGTFYHITSVSIVEKRDKYCS